jgi:hypothetical protein
VFIKFVDLTVLSKFMPRGTFIHVSGNTSYLNVTQYDARSKLGSL